MKASFTIGFFLGLSVLYILILINNKNVKYEELALGDNNKINLASFSGNKVHCHDLEDLPDCLNGYEENSNKKPVTLWLGNSQIHAINQYKNNDKTASYELHQKIINYNRYFLTLSQPNANLKEHLLLFAFLLGNLPIDTLVLPVVFDDMRETGIRPSLQRNTRTFKKS